MERQAGVARHRHRPRLRKALSQWQLYLILLPGALFYLVFHYVPLGGLVIAFKDYGLWTGIIDSPWVGLKHFQRFFSSPDFWLLFKNTFMLGFSSLIFSFPFPIILALLLNEMRFNKLKRFTQTVSYLPTFLSVVVVCSMVIDLLSPQNGMLAKVLQAFGFAPEYYITDPRYFRAIYIISGIWQTTGSGAIIYLASLSNIDTQLYEAADMDGCGRLRKIWNVTLPGMLPTIAIMFIIRSGEILRVGYEKVLLLYNPATYSVADIFATYVYRQGIEGQNYSYAAAVGLFESAVAFIIVIASNQVSKKLNETSLW
ncbi:ABC transporter permease subunit [Ruminococcaceae bacterium OttesenSCG-928-D13]|nr:ABC transporter permease subunit [Ruminococcaceae bacterium OttesenSCG-928-D13]